MIKIIMYFLYPRYALFSRGAQRDSSLAKVPGPCPEASSGKAFEIITPGRYRHAKKATKQLKYEHR